jgi:hypothetical protein
MLYLAVPSSLSLGLGANTVVVLMGQVLMSESRKFRDVHYRRMRLNLFLGLVRLPWL